MFQLQEPSAMAHSLPVQVSPRGFKSNLEVVLEALVQLSVPVTILAKLPQGKSWLEDLENYSHTATAPTNICLFSRQTANQPDWYTAIAIPSAYPMRGEYNLIIISPAIGILLLGHRTTAASDDATDEGLSNGTGHNRSSSNSPAQEISAQFTPQQSEDAEGATRVNLRFVLQRSLIQAKLEDLKPIVQASLAEYPNQPALHTLLTDWDSRLTVPTEPDMTMVETILMQQSRQQERLRRQARLYRSQAMTASSLSTQNEALLDTLRLKDDFLSTVGQELRSPLSTIKTALPLLASPILKPHQRQRYLAMIKQGCDRQSSLVNGVLDLLQLEQSLATVKPEAIDLFNVVPGVVSTYQPIAQERGIRLAYTVPDNLPSVSCPDTWLRQIVIQLLNNSIRYTNAGGEVWVTVQTEEEDDVVVLNIKDTGIGILATDLPRIFEHFYRGRQPPQAEESAGLGLTIVQQLLLYCGGQISVESQPQTGTYCKIRLPVYQAE